MAVQIPLTKGYVAVVDDCDGDLRNRRWCVQVTRRSNYAKRGYWNGKGGAVIYMHRVILSRIVGRELDPSEFCDHADGDGLNNRRDNLRIATPAQNAANHRLSRKNSTGYKGVYFCKATNKWKAAIRLNGKTKGLGSYDSPEKAYAAYCAAAEEKASEFANFGGRE